MRDGNKDKYIELRSAKSISSGGKKLSASYLNAVDIPTNQLGLPRWVRVNLQGESDIDPRLCSRKTKGQEHHDMTSGMLIDG